MSKCISSRGEYSEHEGTGEYCDWWGDCNHARIEAAAEQRGAIKALRSAAQFFSDPGGERFASWAAVQQYLNDRADRMEGDE